MSPRTLIVAGTALIALAIPTSAGAQAHASDMDCSDFSSQAAAQRYFESRGGPASDPDRLDADGDGVACETLPCPCKRPGASPPPRPAPVRRCGGRIFGPSLVRPGTFVAWSLRGFGAGCRLYATVEPRYCHDPRPEQCVLGLGLGPVITTSRFGSATLRFRWPRRYIHTVASMVYHYHPWMPGSQAIVRMNLAEPHQRPGCYERRTTYPGRGGIVCASRTVRIR